MKICKSMAKSGQIKCKNASKIRLRRRLFVNKIYNGYYTHRIIYTTKKFVNRLMFGSLSLAVAIIGI